MIGTPHFPVKMPHGLELAMSSRLGGLGNHRQTWSGSAGTKGVTARRAHSDGVVDCRSIPKVIPASVPNPAQFTLGENIEQHLEKSSEMG